METRTEIPQNSQQPSQPININLSGDTIVIAGLLAWFIWDKIAKPTIFDKLQGAFTPIEEERRLNNILAQMGIITGADRVTLAAFHNGAVDNEGYHLQKLSTVNTYSAPNTPTIDPIKDMPIGRIMGEIENLLRVGGWYHKKIDDPNIPAICRSLMTEWGVDKTVNRMVKVGNLPIGILSVHYIHCDCKDDQECLHAPEYDILMDDLYNEISNIMRRRVVKPSLIKRFMRFFKLSA